MGDRYLCDALVGSSPHGEDVTRAVDEAKAEDPIRPLDARTVVVYCTLGHELFFDV